MNVLDTNLYAFALLAYGAAPGMELIPYFFALLAWVGMALAAILAWPVTALVRRLRRGHTSERQAEKTAPEKTP